MFATDMAARGVSNLLLMIFMLLSGGISNAATFPTIIRYISYVSPSRYATESYFRILL